MRACSRKTEGGTLWARALPGGYVVTVSHETPRARRSAPGKIGQNVCVLGQKWPKVAKNGKNGLKWPKNCLKLPKMGRISAGRPRGYVWRCGPGKNLRPMGTPTLNRWRHSRVTVKPLGAGGWRLAVGGWRLAVEKKKKCAKKISGQIVFLYHAK